MLAGVIQCCVVLYSVVCSVFLLFWNTGRFSRTNTRSENTVDSFNSLTQGDIHLPYQGFGWYLV